MKPQVKNVASQPAWVIRSKDIELSITQVGGHMSPVIFHRNSARPVQPYYISPWQGEDLKIADPVLRPLRGDFFCLPFGAGGQYKNETHYPHGEPALAKWSLKGLTQCGDVTTLTLTMNTHVRPGKVTKKLSLVDGQNVVYTSHVIEGYSDSAPLGHHATLAMPKTEGAMKISTSPIRFGMTNPTPGGDPTKGEYPSVVANQKFKSLDAVKLIWKDPSVGDCSSFPTRRGFVDLLAVFNQPLRHVPGWTTAVVEEEGWMWFSLKDTQVLPTTMLWVENHGRHTPPWNGRNICLGLEDICGYFAMGIAPSCKPNALTKAGVATAVKFSPRRPTVINYIQGVVKIPRGYVKTQDVSFVGDKVVFTSVTGKKVATPVNYTFIFTGNPIDDIPF